MEVRCTAQMGTGTIMQQAIYSMPKEKYQVKVRNIIDKIAKLKVEMIRREQPDHLNGAISGVCWGAVFNESINLSCW